jgi:C2 domain
VLHPTQKAPCHGICYARYAAKKVFASPANEMQPLPSPKWVSFAEDHAMNDLRDREFSGNVLMNLQLEHMQEEPVAKRIAQKWHEHAVQKLFNSDHTLLVHVFQGRCLPAADSNGMLDPFVKVTCSGAEGKVKPRMRTRDPCFYETVSLDLKLPQRR